MDFEKFLAHKVGDKVGFLKSDLEGVSPIVEITESVRPRLIVVTRGEKGGDVMFSLSYNKKTKEAWLQFRIRGANGKKSIPPRVPLGGTKDEHELEEIVALLKEGADEAAQKAGMKPPKSIDIPFNATPKEMIKIIVASGEFDVVEFDDKSNTATKRA